MKKSIKILAALTAVALTLGVAGCTKDTSPNFINPAVSSGEPTSNKYVINVRSMGGTPLNGVIVKAMKDGAEMRRAICRNGKIELDVPLGEYTLEIDPASLPAGYSMPNETFKTNATRREDVTINLPSAVITDPSVTGTYALGQIMTDFVFTDCYGNKYKLSELLKTKKAVALNFFFTACGPCRQEFPAIQRTYTGTDVEFLAICYTGRGDNDSTVAEFKTSMGLTFPMGMDNTGLVAAFGIANFPTTIMIDRYGMIAYRSMGSDISANSWAKLFNDFAADDYKQNFVPAGGGEENPDEPSELEKPNVQMPASSLLEQAANGDGLNATYRAEDDEYSWPWLAGKDDSGNGYIYSSNKGVDNSYSAVYCDIPMKANQVLSLEYNVSSEADMDMLHIMVNGDIVSGTGWSATDGWQTADVFVSNSDQTVELAFVYRKDAGEPEDISLVGEDTAKIRNIHLSSTSALKAPLDVMRKAAWGDTKDFKYENYVTPVLGDDGFYHIGSEDGNILYIAINQLTPWSDLHTSSTSVSGGTTYYNTLYMMTYYNYSQTEPFAITLDERDFTDIITSYWYFQSFMRAPYYLLPVTPELKAWAEAFVKTYESEHGVTAHDKEWLEFCFYYDHYGDAHTGEDTCYAEETLERGATKYMPYTAYEKGDPELEQSETYNSETGRNIARINYPLQTITNGSYYKFKAKRKGVYQVRAYTKDCSQGLDYNGTKTNVAPDIAVFDTDGKFLDGGFGVYDVDALDGVNYEGFNCYLEFDEGEEVFLYLQTNTQETGYYDFEIEYKGETYEKLMVCSVGGGGIWTYDPDTGVSIYDGIPVIYDEDDDRYYAKDANGNASYAEPVYIDMIHQSFLRSDLTDYNFWSLEEIIEEGVFEKHVFEGDIYQSKLQNYLAQAKAKDENDPTYGLVEANAEIVDILDRYIDENVDGGSGVGNGWLMFACYNKHFGK